MLQNYNIFEPDLRILPLKSQEATNSPQYSCISQITNTDQSQYDEMINLKNENYLIKH